MTKGYYCILWSKPNMCVGKVIMPSSEKTDEPPEVITISVMTEMVDKHLDRYTYMKPVAIFDLKGTVEAYMGKLQICNYYLRKTF